MLDGISSTVKVHNLWVSLRRWLSAVGYSLTREISVRLFGATWTLRSEAVCERKEVQSETVCIYVSSCYAERILCENNCLVSMTVPSVASVLTASQF